MSESLTTANLNDDALGIGIGFAIMIPILILFFVIASILAYYSFRGMTKLGICSDRWLPWTLKYIANGMTGGILGLVMYFVGDDKVPVKSKK